MPGILWFTEVLLWDLEWQVIPWNHHTASPSIRAALFPTIQARAIGFHPIRIERQVGQHGIAVAIKHDEQVQTLRREFHLKVFIIVIEQKCFHNLPSKIILNEELNKKYKFLLHTNTVVHEVSSGMNHPPVQGWREGLECWRMVPTPQSSAHHPQWLRGTQSLDPRRWEYRPTTCQCCSPSWIGWYYRPWKNMIQQSKQVPNFPA